MHGKVSTLKKNNSCKEEVKEKNYCRLNSNVGPRKCAHLEDPWQLLYIAVF